MKRFWTKIHAAREENFCNEMALCGRLLELFLKRGELVFQVGELAAQGGDLLFEAADAICVDGADGGLRSRGFA